jgi:hypothetical protein
MDPLGISHRSLGIHRAQFGNHHPTCFNLHNPSSGGFSYKGKHDIYPVKYISDLPEYKMTLIEDNTPDKTRLSREMYLSTSKMTSQK